MVVHIVKDQEDMIDLEADQEVHRSKAQFKKHQLQKPYKNNT
jgi:hypothetical protein